MTARTQNDNTIHLIRAAQAWPFVDTLSRLGGPVVSLSRRAGMPLEAARNKRGVIGEYSLWRFVEYAAEQLKLDHFGYLTAVQHPVNSTGELGGFRMRMAPTVKDLLRYFIEDVQTQSTGTNYKLKSEANHTWFDRAPIFRESGAGWQAEQYVIMFVIQIVRLFAGDEWLPSRLRIASRSSPVPVPTQWFTIDIEWDHPSTAILIGNDVLSLANPDFESARQRLGAEIDKASISLLQVGDLVDRQIWSGTLGIDHAAAELGLSVTTFKRRLRDDGQSYSAIVENRRHHWATKLLREQHVSISSVADTLGYAHAANFTRAFSRVAGITPTAFRRQSERGSDE